MSQSTASFRSRKSRVDPPKSYVRVLDKDGNFASQPDLDVLIEDLIDPNSVGRTNKIVTILGFRDYTNSTNGNLDNLFDTNNVGLQSEYGVVKRSNILVFFTRNLESFRIPHQDFSINLIYLAVAISDILVIHSTQAVYEHIGATDSIKALFQAIFTAHLLFFSQLQRHVLTRIGRLHLLIVADGDPSYPERMEAHFAAITRSTWESVAKQFHTANHNRSWSDYFDITTHTISELRNLTELKQQLVVDNRDGLFKPQYHKHIPIDGLVLHVKFIWERLEAMRKSRTVFSLHSDTILQLRSHVMRNLMMNTPENPSSDDESESQLDPDNPILSGLIFRLRDAVQSVGGAIRPFLTDNNIRFLIDLLVVKNHVNIILRLENPGDVELFLDFLINLLDKRHKLYQFNPHVLDAPRKIRRIIHKLVTKVPVIPRSMYLWGVMVDRTRYAGVGGFSNVLIGMYQGSEVALKLLNIQRHNNFEREALTWRSLNHESVLRFLGIHKDGPETERTLFLVSPFMKNGTLAHWRKNTVPDTRAIRKRLLEVAEGLQYIHSEGIVHGDIRGTNVLLDFDLHAKIADFGLTRHFDATATQSETMSPNFAAPELFGWLEHDDDVSSDSDDGGKVARTSRSDVYAFGCLFYEIQFNTIPFGALQYHQILRQVLQRKRPARLEFPPLNEEDWKLVKRCWRHEPTKRPMMDDVVETMLGL